jgi:hypothetical protein
MTALASIALATAAGYVLEESLLPSGEYQDKLSKVVTGFSGSPFVESAYFVAASTALALPGVLAALNGQRYYRYGQGATINKGNDGVTGTVDVT